MRHFNCAPRQIRALKLAAGLALIVGCSDAGTGTATSPPSALAAVSGMQQVGTAGVALSTPIVVRVTDASNNPLARITVEFIVTAGGGTLSDAAVLTDAAGNATDTWTLGTSATVPQTVEAHALDPKTGSPIGTVTISATVRAAAPAHLETLGGNEQSGLTGTTLTDSLAVRVTDQFGNVAAGVPVTWTPDAGSGTVAPTTSNTDSIGVARTSWQLGSTVGDQQVVAKSGTVQQTFTARATPAAVQVVLSSHAIALTIGSAQQLSAQAVDNLGALVTRPAVWQSTDAAVATVSLTGLVTAISAGSARVIATVDRLSDTATVSVSPVSSSGGVVTTTATDIGASSATIKAQVTSGSTGPIFYFEYGRDPALTGASTTASQLIPPASVGITIADQVAALAPSTQYYFRGVLVTTADTLRGSILSFTTTAAAGQAATVVTLNPTALSTSSATLHGSVTPNGSATTTRFEYGTDALLAGASQSAAIDAGAGAAPFAADFAATGLAANTMYYYRIVATNSAGTSRGSIVSFRTTATSVPTTTVQATYDFVHGVVGISWVLGVPGGSTVHVTRTEGGVTTQLGTVDIGTTTFTDLTVDASSAHAFTYGIATCDSTGCAPAATQTLNVPRLEPPSDLTATVALDGTTTLHWLDHSNNEAEFAIYDRATDGTYGPPTTVPANTMTFTTTIPVGVTRDFVVRAKFASGAGPSALTLPYSAPSNEVVATTPSAGQVPIVVTTSVTELTFSSARFNGTVNPNGLATQVHFEYGTDPTLASPTNTFSIDAGLGNASIPATAASGVLSANTTYYVRLVATNGAGTTKGNIVSFHTAKPSQTIAGLQAAYDSPSGAIQLSWTASTETGISFYSINRLESTGAVRTYRTTGLQTTLKNDDIDPSTSHSYTYTVDACNAAGCGTPSAPVNGLAPRLEPPTDLTITVTADGTTTLHWTDNSSNESGFSVYIRANGETYQGEAAVLPANTTTYTTTSVPGTTHYYAVRADLPARSDIGFPLNQPRSLPSNEVLGTTPSTPQAPVATTLAESQVGRTGAGLNGTVAPNGLPTTLHFEWGTSPSLASPNATPNLDAGAGSQVYGAGISISQLTPNTTYYYRVVGVNSLGTSLGQIVSFTTTP